MNSTVPVYAERRAHIFWNTCIPMRVFLFACTFVACKSNIRVIESILSIYLLSWGIGMFGNFASHFQIDGIEYGNFGGVVWWQWQRLLHGICLISYAISSLLFRWKFAYVFTLIDICIAVISGAVYYNQIDLMNDYQTVFAIIALFTIISFTNLALHTKKITNSAIFMYLFGNDFGISESETIIAAQVIDITRTGSVSKHEKNRSRIRERA
jgi:hypothetical protein